MRKGIDKWPWFLVARHINAIWCSDRWQCAMNINVSDSTFNRMSEKDVNSVNLCILGCIHMCSMCHSRDRRVHTDSVHSDQHSAISFRTQNATRLLCCNKDSLLHDLLNKDGVKRPIWNWSELFLSEHYYPMRSTCSAFPLRCVCVFSVHTFSPWCSFYRSMLKLPNSPSDISELLSKRRHISPLLLKHTILVQQKQFGRCENE